jgi:hypothetical protein
VPSESLHAAHSARPLGFGSHGQTAWWAQSSAGTGTLIEPKALWLQRFAGFAITGGSSVEGLAVEVTNLRIAQLDCGQLAELPIPTASAGTVDVPAVCLTLLFVDLDPIGESRLAEVRAEVGHRVLKRVGHRRLAHGLHRCMRMVLPRWGWVKPPLGASGSQRSLSSEGLRWLVRRWLLAARLASQSEARCSATRPVIRSGGDR